MPHGTPDWWGVERTTTVHLMQDAAELAARLQSEVAYDRRGRVVMIEDFENGYKTWTVAKSGTGADAHITATTSFSGAYSLEIIGGSDGGKYTRVYRWVPTYVLGPIGLSVVFAHSLHVDRFEMHLWVRTGPMLYQGGWRFDHTNLNIDYLDSAGVWQTVDNNKDLVTGPKHWHALKVVLDSSTGKYIRGLVNEDQHDLSTYALRSWAAAEPTYIIAEFYAYSEAGFNADAYIDDVILTVDEPV